MKLHYKSWSLEINPVFALIVGGVYIVNRLIDKDKFESLDMNLGNQRLMLNK